MIGESIGTQTEQLYTPTGHRRLRNTRLMHPKHPSFGQCIVCYQSRSDIGDLNGQDSGRKRWNIQQVQQDVCGSIIRVMSGDVHHTECTAKGMQSLIRQTRRGSRGVPGEANDGLDDFNNPAERLWLHLKN